MEHDLFRKTVPTFGDQAQVYRRVCPAARRSAMGHATTSGRSDRLPALGTGLMKNESPGATADAPPHAGNPPTPRITLLELFLLFSQLGLSSFGGAVSAWVHRAFVVRRGLIGEAEFGAALGLARIIPGANVVNLAVMLGHRLRGAAGDGRASPRD